MQQNFFLQTATFAKVGLHAAIHRKE